MEIKKLQQKVSKIFLNNLRRDNIQLSDDYLLLKLTEELGEFTQAFLVHKKRCRPAKYLPVATTKKELAKELSDVLGLTLVIAKHLHIDLETALVKKWITREWLKK